MMEMIRKLENASEEVDVEENMVFSQDSADEKGRLSRGMSRGLPYC